jgi:hypothetical protein
MKAIHNWHRTTWGRIARFLGSINLAVPVLVFVAAALAWGTYLESAHNVKVARAAVYGSWWFIGLMGLTCVSLVFAVITRYPWKRKHIGFMTVHAGLIALIVGGFWSLFGRIEGQLPLDAGTQSNVITTDTEQVELLRHINGEFQPVATSTLEYGKNTLTIGTTKLEILARWENSREEAYVVDDAEAPLRAVQLSIDPPRMGPSVDNTWVGEETHGASPAIEKGIRIRVLPAGQEWTKTQGVTTGYLFVAGDKEAPVPAEGQEIIPGWKVESIRRFQHAMVTGAGLQEAGNGADNPAIEVTIADTSGSREQHRAFLNFPDMVMGKPLAGEARSGLKLIARPQDTTGGETLVIYGTPPALKVAYIAPDNASQEFETAALTAPWSFKAGNHSITISQQFTHARAASRLVQAPKSNENRPALVVRVSSNSDFRLPTSDFEATPLLWRQPTPLPIEVAEGQDPVMVRFGPRLVQLPFTVKLTQFRKRDYPGTDMAMSYESDVNVTMPDGATKSQTISMNEPFKGEGWKVYQSGFIGTDVSIFSIMKDPGLPLTYIGCITLCIGIALTFYSRALSTGHPGIPALFGSRKENGHASPPEAPSVPAPDLEPAAALKGSASAEREPELVAN